MTPSGLASPHALAVTNSPPRALLRLAIVGGGVSGLAAAHRLGQLLPHAALTLFEAGPRLGGPLASERRGELVLEHGADSFLTRDPVVVELCRELGLGDELLPTNAAHRRALVVHAGRLEPVPDGFVLMRAQKLSGILRTRVLSVAGKLRLCMEPFVRAPAAVASPGYDESVARFATRRLGRETFERLVEPLLAGIYVADAAELSLAATMPEFLAAEREFGSLRAAVRARSFERLVVPDPQHAATPTEGDRGEEGSGARYGAFVTLRSGLGSLVEAITRRLPAGAVRLSTSVSAIAALDEQHWSIATTSGGKEQFHGVVLAIPAAHAAGLVGSVDAELAGLIAQIRAASSVVVTLMYAPRQIARPLDGFGFVVPRVENRPILAGSFPGVKFPGRGSAELTPMRVFLGGALRPEINELDDDELITLAHGELADLLGIGGGPREATVARWRESMPQYRVGHLELVDAIERRAANHAGLELAGASYRGVGIPHCIRSGRRAAERLAEQLAT
jgi:oxygen-dependent protoporphyrinogen oxidase